MRKAGTLIVASAVSLLLLGTMAMAQAVGSMGSNSDKGRVPASDRQFMLKAAQGGMAEVELGQLAQQNGQSQDVKDFGKRMVDDHSKANDELKQLASDKGVSLPTDLNAKDKATKDRLSKLNGAAFDKAYMNDMVKDHKMDVAEFKHESMAAKDPQVKDWAGKTLPTLQSHLDQAEKIAPKVQASSTSSNSMSNK
jgi:putative membrane protein